MPWLPEHFSAPALQQVLDQRRRDRLVAVPYFDGLMAGEPDALVDSFDGEPELHDPVRGRVKGRRAFMRFAAQTREWLARHHAWVEDVEHVALPGCGFEEVVLHLEGDTGPVALPFAIVAVRRSGLIGELRVYGSRWPLTGRHVSRPPLLQPDPELQAPGALAEYQRALAAGDVDAVVAAFEPGGSVREPAGGEAFTHRGPERLRAFYERWFSNGGGIALEPCALIDGERACTLEYNLVRWGTTALPPQAGVGVYVRGPGGGLTAVRIYDDADPPFGPATERVRPG